MDMNAVCLAALHPSSLHNSHPHRVFSFYLSGSNFTSEYNFVGYITSARKVKPMY